MQSEVSALETGQAKLWILLVGVDEYYDRRLPSLQYSTIDCQGLATALTHATQKFTATTIRVHHDAAELAPTAGAVRKSLEEIVTHAQSEDTVLFYFCGHSGLESRFQQAVLCFADTEKDSLLKTGLSLMSLLGQLGNCAAKQQILWLDLFHGNGMASQGSDGQLPFDNPAWQLNEMLSRHTREHPGFSALLSCDAAQRTRGTQPQQSWKFPELGQSVFAHFLIEGLKGEAANRHGVIEANGLAEYVTTQTVEFIDRSNQDLRRLHEPDSKREGLLLSPKYMAQSPKLIGQGFASSVVGLKLPDLLASAMPVVEQRKVAEPIVLPLDSEVEKPPEPETIALKSKTSDAEVISPTEDTDLASSVVNEWHEAIATEETLEADSSATTSPDVEALASTSPEVWAEPITESDLETVSIPDVETEAVQIEPSTEFTAETVSNLVSDLVVDYAPEASLDQLEPSNAKTIEPISELIFEPVAEEPISNLISDPLIEYVPEANLSQAEHSTELSSESTEPTSELIFEPVIGTVVEEPISSLVSDPIIEYVSEANLSQIEPSTESSAETIEPISELIFEPVLGAVAEDPISSLVSDPVVEYVSETDLSETETSTELDSVESTSELIFEPVLGAVVEEPIEEPIKELVEEPVSDLASDPVIEYLPEVDLDQFETSAEDSSELIFEPVLGSVVEETDSEQAEVSTEPVLEPAIDDGLDQITESVDLEVDEPVDLDLEETNPETIDDLDLFVNSVHKAVGNTNHNSVSETDPSTSSEVPQVALNGRVARESFDRRLVQPSTSLHHRLNTAIDSIQRSSQEVANTGQAIYQEQIPALHNAWAKTIARFDQSTRQIAQATTATLQDPRAKKTAIVALSGVGLAAIGFTGFSLYQQRNTQLNTIQSLNANSTTLLSSNRATEALIDGLKAGQQFQQLDRPWNFVPEPIKLTTIATLQQAIAQVTNQTQPPATLEAGLRNATLSPDGKTFAAVTSKQTIQLWQREGNQLKPLNIELNGATGAHEAPITQISFSPNGKILASASEDKTVKLWDVEKGTLINTLTGHKDRVTAISFRSDGDVLASASNDRTIKLWGVSSGRSLDTFKGHEAEISVMTFSPDGRIFAAGSTANAIYLWFPDSNKPILLGRHQAASPSPSQGISDLAFSPDGKTIASASWTDAIKLWTVSDGKSNQEAKPRQTLESNTRATSLSFSPDATWLASGEQDGTIQLWNLNNSSLVKTLMGHQGSVQKVAVNADGKGLTSVSDRNGLMVWSLDLTTLMSQGCNLVQNELRANPTLQNTNLCR